MRCQFRGNPPRAASRLALIARLVREGRLESFGLRNRPTRAERGQALPELMDALGAVPDVSPTFLADLASLGDVLFADGSGLSLEGCEYRSPGRVWISCLREAPPTEVRRGDSFCAGALFAGDAKRGNVRVACRLLRLVCTNGLILPVSGALGTPVYERFPDGGTEGDLDAVLGAATEDRVIQVSRALLARATAAHAATPEHGLVVLGLADRALLPPAVHAAFAEEREPTVYGVLNAVTRTARDAETLVERESLERLAGEMVVRLYGITAAAGAPALQPI